MDHKSSYGWQCVRVALALHGGAAGKSQFSDHGDFDGHLLHQSLITLSKYQYTYFMSCALLKSYSSGEAEWYA